MESKLLFNSPKGLIISTGNLTIRSETRRGPSWVIEMYKLEIQWLFTVENIETAF